MNNFLDDKMRFVTILKFLPEKFVDDFVNYYLWNAKYPVEANEILFKYAEYKKEILSEFSNSKINDARINFNKSFDVLTKFLTDHFWIPNQQYEMHKNPPFFYLEPRIHHNFGGKNMNPILWHKYKSELEKIANEFKETYKNFIKIAKIEIEQKDEIVKLSPEIHGVGVNLKLLWKKIKSGFMNFII